MFESIDVQSSVAVYVQIENLAQFAITSGELKAGDRLPSIHQLADQLRINFNTVAKAYRDLEVMGLTKSRRGMGVFVAEGAEARCQEQCRRQVIERIHEVVTEAKAAGMSVKEVRDAAEKSYACDTGPYKKPPASLMALAKSGEILKRRNSMPGS